MSKLPSLFTFADAETGISMTIDLAKVALISKRPQGGGYYVNLGGQSIPCPDNAGETILAAWLAFQGKFVPGQTS
jgi:hypothetical protein